MLNHILTSIFGSRNKRVLKRLYHNVALINAKEPYFTKLSDSELQAKTPEFRARLQQGASLDDLLPEAFAVVREAARRTLKMRHFDVQLIGGMVLHSGNIAEMRTGEGKTLVSTLAAYLNALAQQGVHIVTVNDYLAKRDASWMQPIYEFLGLSVGVVIQNMDLAAKQQAYAADITYGTNNEFGFDYLRDNMALSASEKVQRATHYAIIDEVDSILVDEARTPLIISGPADDSMAFYTTIDTLVPQLKLQTQQDSNADYSLDEKTKQVYLTELGQQRVEELLMASGLLKDGDNLYDSNNIILLHHLHAALRAHSLFHRDIDYIVQRGDIVIVDEHTGRAMPGRRWADGLHQALEAKEKVKINPENHTLATITFQNYFRSYTKLAGMTGTADTEAYELQQIYGLEVVVIPPNKTMIRQDLPDFVFISSQEKFKAIVADITAIHHTKQPILVGTTSIEASEFLSALLKKAGIAHKVLNAKYHETEAAIIAEAGRPGAVTIATNMAGRGTDIVLGGNLAAELASLTPEAYNKHQQDWQHRHAEVVALGGLYVLGTERHESRRIDNQLRGRAGRQGDPGKSRFYLSLEDNLLRIFGGERLRAVMSKIGLEQSTAIESRLLSRSIENAQRKVEAYNFDIRKQLLEYDDVANEQRKVIYQQRNALLLSTNLTATIDDMCQNIATSLATQFWPQESLLEHCDFASLETILAKDFKLELQLLPTLTNLAQPTPQDLSNYIYQELSQQLQQQLAHLDPDTLLEFAKTVILQTLDKVWREHLAAMDYLRQGIHLRSYAQKNPKQEYKLESFALFANMLNKINHEALIIISQLNNAHNNDTLHQQQQLISQLQYQHQELPASTATIPPAIQQLNPKQTMLKLGRNQPCFCGSGKKYKHCHGAI